MKTIQIITELLFLFYFTSYSSPGLMKWETNSITEIEFGEVLLEQKVISFNVEFVLK